MTQRDGKLLRSEWPRGALGKNVDVGRIRVNLASYILDRDLLASRVEDFQRRQPHKMRIAPRRQQAQREPPPFRQLRDAYFREPIQRRGLQLGYALAHFTEATAPLRNTTRCRHSCKLDLSGQ